MSAAWIIKTIDISEDSQFSSMACVPSISLHQFSLDSFEESEEGKEAVRGAVSRRKIAALS